MLAHVWCSTTSRTATPRSTSSSGMCGRRSVGATGWSSTSGVITIARAYTGGSPGIVAPRLLAPNLQSRTLFRRRHVDYRRVILDVLTPRLGKLSQNHGEGLHRTSDPTPVALGLGRDHPAHTSAHYHPDPRPG